MAFGNIQAQDLDPSLDLAKETTLNGVKSAVDEISTSMADVAKESTVAEVKPVLVEFNNKVGTSDDAESQPTLFGKLAQLGQLVPEKLAEVIGNITGLDTKIGTSGDVAGAATLFGQMKNISENSSGGGIKSIQRGNVTFSNTNNKTINISEVDPSKTIVLLTCSIAGSTQTYAYARSDTTITTVGGSMSILVSLNATQFVITPCYQNYYSNTGSGSFGSADTSYGKVSYQVIEFN